jgi:PAS domain S-box-containing protein
MQSLTSLAQSIRDPRIATHVASAAPAFVVGHDGSLRFANYSALGLIGAESWGAVTDRLETIHPFLDIARDLLSELPPDGSALTERIRFPAADGERAIAFSCSPLVLADGMEAVLLVGPETNRAPDAVEATKALFDGERSPLLLTDLNGKPVHANPPASVLFASANNLADALPGASHAIARARNEGAAEFPFGVLKIFIRRIEAAEPLLLTLIAEPARPKPVEETVTVAAEAPAEPEAVAEIAAEEIVEAAPVVEAASEPKPVFLRAPSRFVWQTDAEAKIVSVSPELAAVVGDTNASITGMNWTQIAHWGVTGAEAAGEAIERRDTWSGITVLWPVDATTARPVDLAALPVFGRERNFEGYRGFGVFREAVERPAPAIETPVEETAAEPPVVEQTPAPEPDPVETPVLTERPENVVPLHKAPEPERPALTAGERNAFREIARVIGSKLQDEKQPEEPKPFGKRMSDVVAVPPKEPSEAVALGDVPVIARAANGERAVLDRLPLGIVVHRGEKILYANKTLLEWTGFVSAEELAEAGGLSRLFAQGLDFSGQDAGERPLHLAAQGGEFPVEARLLSAPWEGETALVYVLRRAGSGIDERMEAGEMALREAEATARELRAILDTATDGVTLMDRTGTVLGLNRSAEALFGFESSEIEGRNFTSLFAPESHRSAQDYLDGLASNGVASVLNDGREVIGRVREGGLIPLFMTLGRVGDNTGKFCAVFRDITQWKRAEEDLIHAKRQAESASSAKSEFLAKISHEIRTPLNAILGFSEVMMEERFGPIGNDRYREYLRDIHQSGEHLISLINDLLDLSKIEAGKLDLNFASVDLNEIAGQCMAIMQPQANRERIIIRTALSPDVPPVVADARSIRQIVLNLLSNSIKFTQPGGQVIVSTTLTETGEVHLRVRDTGIGMSDAEIKMALEPFRQVNTRGRTSSGGTGLGLPLTKALVEANRAAFSIRSTVNAGTLVEVAFPSTRVLAE